MNSTEILEGNKLIAEFMGGIVIDRIFIRNEKTKSYNERCLHHYNISQARYHCSWDWLMPVVEKIESLRHPVYINSNNCIIYEKIGKNHGWFIDNYADTKIEATWISCVRFITTYNKNNNK